MVSTHISFHSKSLQILTKFSKLFPTNFKRFCCPWVPYVICCLTILIVQNYLIHRFLQVKFEDLIDNTEKTFRNIATKLELVSEKKLMEAYQKHSEVLPTKKHMLYFSTIRTKNYSHNHWENELNFNHRRYEYCKYSCERMLSHTSNCTDFGFHQF